MKIDENVLCCPKCNGVNLHQGKTNVFNRYTEDDHYGLHIEVSGTAFNASDRIVGSPSERRNGLSIEFMCENCGGVGKLAIYQHKGSTYMEWKL